MPVWTRLFSKAEEPTPPKPPKPHDFCSQCGKPMVNGYLVESEGFDTETGEPILHVYKRRLCSTQHGKKAGKQSEAHDGGYILSYMWGWGSDGTTIIRRPCPPAPAKKGAK